MVKASGVTGNAHIQRYGGDTARRINLFASDRQLFTGTLPHEIGHLVAWDLFGRPLPIWAAEGMAAMAEQRAPWRMRRRVLRRALRQGRTYRLSTLLALVDYPSGRKGVFYAQAASLTRYLVKLGSAPHFVMFVRRMLDKGALVALRSSYRIRGYRDLEQRWRRWSALGGDRSPPDMLQSGGAEFAL